MEAAEKEEEDEETEVEKEEDLAEDGIIIYLG